MIVCFGNAAYYLIGRCSAVLPTFTERYICQNFEPNISPLKLAKLISERLASEFQGEKAQFRENQS